MRAPLTSLAEWDFAGSFKQLASGTVEQNCAVTATRFDYSTMLTE
jgi:hypothetical protein